jgi:flagellar biosynthesis chaperone FliJ
MTEDQEQNMRSQLADYGKGELIDLAIQLQNLVDGNMTVKRGMQQSIDAMSQQIPLLQARIDEYENAEPVDNDEVVQLRELVAKMTARNEELQALNEGLQKKLIG